MRPASRFFSSTFSAVRVLLLAKNHEMDSAYRKEQREEYQQWLEKAAEGGMRGPFRALKKPDTKIVQPCRDQLLELRVHPRRQYPGWMFRSEAKSEHQQRLSHVICWLAGIRCGPPCMMLRRGTKPPSRTVPWCSGRILRWLLAVLSRQICQN